MSGDDPDQPRPNLLGFVIGVVAIVVIVVTLAGFGLALFGAVVAHALRACGPGDCGPAVPVRVHRLLRRAQIQLRCLACRRVLTHDEAIAANERWG